MNEKKEEGTEEEGKPPVEDTVLLPKPMAKLGIFEPLEEYLEKITDGRPDLSNQRKPVWPDLWLERTTSIPALDISKSLRLYSNLLFNKVTSKKIEKKDN